MGEAEGWQQLIQRQAGDSCCPGEGTAEEGLPGVTEVRR